jgi:hypothetical protein
VKCATASTFWERRPEASTPILKEESTLTPFTRKLLVATAAAISAAGVLAANAAAYPPTRETVTVISRPITPCPSGVGLVGVFNVTREITTFYDDEGNPVRRLWVASFVGTMTNPLTGASLPNRGIRVFHWDLVTGELFTTGTNIVTKLPDGGVAIGGAGRLVFDAQGRLIEHNGPDTGAERAQLCEALGA